MIPLPDSVPLEIGAILDPFGNAVHTVLSFDVVGEDVLITGADQSASCRPLWLATQGRHVVLTDVNPYRLELARKVEPDIRTVNVAGEDLTEVMNELGMKRALTLVWR